MSNPFPGMDPYLEGPMWSSFHNSLIEEIAWQLTPKLRPKYRARSAERVVVAVPDPIELAEYDQDINYSSGPAVALSPEQQTWADERLRATGRL